RRADPRRRHRRTYAHDPVQPRAEPPAAAHRGGHFVSLILEALKKIERDKDVAARGFSVHAAQPWPSRHRGRLTGALAALLLVAAGMAVGLAWRPSAPPAPVSTA